jgi:hypothetical protein
MTKREVQLSVWRQGDAHPKSVGVVVDVSVDDVVAELMRGGSKRWDIRSNQATPSWGTVTVYGS